MPAQYPVSRVYPNEFYRYPASYNLQESVRIVIGKLISKTNPNKMFDGFLWQKTSVFFTYFVRVPIGIGFPVAETDSTVFFLWNN